MIYLKNIIKIYGEKNAEKKVLNEISLHVSKGEMLAIMGPSGSGKSTLLNILGCMDEATDGEYLFEDLSVFNLKRHNLDKFRRDNIAFIFQYFALMNDFTVYENVELPLKIKRVSRKKRKEIVSQYLKKMDIWDVKDQKTNKISGGQAQRTAIARALATGSKLILADEPTGALDQKTGMNIMNIFEELHKEGYTIIVVTHDNNVANRCDRILNIKDGRIENS